jgi:hypothetical protein
MYGDRIASFVDAVESVASVRAALRPPADEAALDATAETLELPVPAVLRSLYAKHDGISAEHMRLYVFPGLWRWMPLSEVAGCAEMLLAAQWRERFGIAPFPFASRVGDLLAVDSEQLDRLWYLTPMEPPMTHGRGGSFGGYLADVTAAYRGENPRMKLTIEGERLIWLES